ncbi:hypothetical protein [Anaeromyxobacter paludicola]|uniref:Uncharacterized protein n=1 Tax=Anaeromyxobacter paludicola TaxID=2918171 RepID=A0ABM7X872_9BACT|nr:hypothetical protein [Anaeromyxobacter paludicola]BDG08050.1 hypothetical protein AMPC_11630 [Anaeromyxobacter paludicola]
MFQPDPSLRFIPATRERVVAIVESINQPQISVPGRPAQAVQGYLVGLRNPGGSFSVFVVLSLPASGENVVYLHDRREVGIEDYRGTEVEGLQFLESMGFMLDNLNFRNLAPELQERTLKRITAFGVPPPPAAAAPRDPRQALGRLLSSF